ncbi:MAG: ribonuclease R [Cuneatibacter sp.]|nr:ribonuclease R [Cuneatibacter sp.]
MEKTKMEKRKEMILAFLGEKQYRPMRRKELAVMLQVAPEDREAFAEVLDALLEEGRITINKKGRYSRAEQIQVTGVLETNPRGFGFVKVEDMEQDVFIAEENLDAAMQGDTVRVQLLCMGSREKRPEGRVVQILEHGITEIVGTYQKNRRYGFVVPDNRRIAYDLFIPEGKSMDAEQGDKVVAKITEYGTLRKSPEGVVTEVLGGRRDPGVDILSAARSMNLPMDFPEEVLEQVKTVPSEVHPDELAGRRDFRDWQTVTIDGADAKDLDDAITLTKLANGHYQLGVHIADVSHYVTEGSPLDEEAVNRSTSVYLLDRVIPMLPRELSNGICSLNQSVDRLTMTCLMEVDSAGVVVDHEIVEGVIRVDRRMTYTAVQQVLDGEEAVRAEYAEFVPFFELMLELSELLRSKRGMRGAIDFDFPESKIELNEKGIPVDVHPYERNRAAMIIEDFMLLANETVAEDAYWQQLPFLYRVHQEPDTEKLRRFVTFIQNLGYTLHLGGSEIHPKELQQLLDKIAGKPEEPVISRLMLRSMQQARYSTTNDGHFGLSAKYYCHFTSPIRRYPDLQIHRILKEAMHGGMQENRRAHYEEILPAVALETSQKERRADEAERVIERMKIVQYMTKHIGEVYTGIISGITAWGMYVELPNTVEGLIHVSNLDGDYFNFQEETYAMVGEMTGKSYRLGQKIRIRVMDADMEQQTIDFVPARDWE